ncbi:MAG: type III pantothenate kinase [Alphaproteobacteria bacterium]|nr:type III pantothenate kinase [Alphaproteobacteria bacterium]
MLLTLDVGNTNIVLGIYKGRGKSAKLMHCWRLGTVHSRTADEYGALIQSLLVGQKIPLAAIKRVAISSVVPPANRDLSVFSRLYFKTDPFFVSAQSDLGMTIRYDEPMSVGADRICNTVGAFHKYGGPLIVVDYGTATTFDVIGDNGDYLGGAIAPGIGISMDALFHHAARLYPVEFKTPPATMGKNTINSMQSGAVFGFAGQTDALVRRLQKEIGKKKAKVIATGGLATLIQKNSETLEEVDQTLTLEGLRILFERQEKLPSRGEEDKKVAGRPPKRPGERAEKRKSKRR